MVFALLWVRAGHLQLVAYRGYREQARAERQQIDTIPAPRGAITDRHGEGLAVTEPAYRIGLAPVEVVDSTALSRVREVVGDRPRRWWTRLDDQRYWYWHGPFTASRVYPLMGTTGVHLEPFWRRRYPAGARWPTLLGITDPDNPQDGLAGLERVLDEWLKGTPGYVGWLRDARGRRYRIPGLIQQEPIPGCAVTLTLDAQVQAVVEAILAEGVEMMRADGGEIVLLEPATGKVVAIAGVTRDPQTGRLIAKLSPLTDPFEPGSTAKIFTAAAVLATGTVHAGTTVEGSGGVWTMSVGRGKTRTITDVHGYHGPMTLHRAIQVSSNVAVARFAMEFLSPAQQFSMLHEFGFGERTGIELGREAAGTLRPVERWQPLLTMPSIAMGYEWQVTAVQLAAAYAAIANGGTYHAPRIVEKISCPDGRAPSIAEPVSRRVIPEVIADTLRAYLRDVVSGQGGTARRANLSVTTVAGKTGTAVQTVNGRYVRGRYTSSFAGFAPADAPEVAFVVTISNPQGAYYGGATAAPLLRRLFEQLIASDVRDARWRRLGSVLVTPTLPQWSSGTPDSIDGFGARDCLSIARHRGVPVEIIGDGPVCRQVDSLPARTRVYLTAAERK
jgi:cell division protein FtsI (penicillin-binding protein 3)